MKNIQEYIESGVLELYVMEALSEEECLEVEQLAEAHPEIQDEIEAIQDSLESYAMAHAVEPHDDARHMYLATLNYIDHMAVGAIPTEVPAVLEPGKSPEDFQLWLDHPVFQAPEVLPDTHVVIMHHSEALTSGIVWIRNDAMGETHHSKSERFLILEGTCDIDIEGEIHSLKAGDYLEIPLHKHHEVFVTSEVPCKILLQRVAA